MQSINSASLYFNADWQRYQETVANNVLYHREVMEELSQFLNIKFGNSPFSFVDVGCGDSSVIASLLATKSIQEYVGIDAAPDILELSSMNISNLNCETILILEDMTTAIPGLSSTYDVIYTSFAVHHLSLSQKIAFIQTCYDKLKPNGFFLMVDGARSPQQTRNDWLNILETRMREAIPEITENELEYRMRHPRADDYPEDIETFRNIAFTQNWKQFKVLMQNDLMAFIVFEK